MSEEGRKHASTSTASHVASGTATLDEIRESVSFAHAW